MLQQPRKTYANLFLVGGSIANQETDQSASLRGWLADMHETFETDKTESTYPGFELRIALPCLEEDARFRISSVYHPILPLLAPTPSTIHQINNISITESNMLSYVIEPIGRAFRAPHRRLHTSSLPLFGAWLYMDGRRPLDDSSHIPYTLYPGGVERARKGVRLRFKNKKEVRRVSRDHSFRFSPRHHRHHHHHHHHQCAKRPR